MDKINEPTDFSNSREHHAFERDALLSSSVTSTECTLPSHSLDESFYFSHLLGTDYGCSASSTIFTPQSLELFDHINNQEHHSQIEDKASVPMVSPSVSPMSAGTPNNSTTIESCGYPLDSTLQALTLAYNVAPQQHEPDMVGSVQALQAEKSFRAMLEEDVFDSQQFTPAEKRKFRKRAYTIALPNQPEMFQQQQQQQLPTNQQLHLPTIPEMVSYSQAMENTYSYNFEPAPLNVHNLPLFETISSAPPLSLNTSLKASSLGGSRRRSVGAYDISHKSSSGTGKGDQIFVCAYPDCNKTFSRYYNLKSHTRTHTGERPFVCDHENCGARFGRNHDLKRHKRVHTGDRPYRCDHCGKMFSRLDALNRHLKVAVDH